MATSSWSSEAYAARTVCFLGVWEQAGWALKVYGIAYRSARPRDALVAAAKNLSRRHLPTPATGEGRYGVGFLGVHEGRGANLVFVDWWADQNELHHLVFTAPHDRPLDLEPVDPSGPIACVWDLAIVSFERKAWIATALLDPGSRDLERYLATWFEGAV